MVFYKILIIYLKENHKDEELFLNINEGKNIIF